MSRPLSLRSASTAAETRVVLLFTAASLLAVTVYRLWPGSHLWTPAAIAGISIAIWHGAYDTGLARARWAPRYPGEWLLPFVAAYVGVAALVLVAWWLVPLAALVAFLLYSGLHFGIEAEPDRSPLRLIGAAALGCLPIAAACHWQASAVSPIFSTMLRGKTEAAEQVTSAAGAFLLPCILLACLAVVRCRRDLAKRALVVSSSLLLFRFCPPVLAFAVFFCTLHTPEHLVETSRTAASDFSMDRMWQNLRHGMVPWFISLAAVAMAAYVGRHTMLAYTGVLFIALSALTVPHMILGMLPASAISSKSKQSFQSAQRMAHS